MELIMLSGFMTVTYDLLRIQIHLWPCDFIFQQGEQSIVSCYAKSCDTKLNCTGACHVVDKTLSASEFERSVFSNNNAILSIPTQTSTIPCDQRKGNSDGEMVE